MKILDGKTLAYQIQENLKKEISLLKTRKIEIAFILVGNDLASKTYVKMKKKRCLEIGMASKIYEFPASVSEKTLLDQIEICNHSDTIDGILVQQPLPKHISPSKVFTAISPNKDVDGFHPLNMGKLLLGQEGGFTACTPLGIINMLKHYHIDPKGKHAVIVGRSDIVGKPLAALLIQKKAYANATVTLAHSQTTHLKEICLSADILIGALGKALFIKEDMVKEGAIVIDVGINRLQNKKLVGDVDFEHVKKKCEAITPVPGGIGPMTIAMLLSNTLESYRKRCISTN